MSLGTVTMVDQIGKCFGDIAFIDRITVVGPASYSAGGYTGLLAALKLAANPDRTILGAICTSQRAASGGTALTSMTPTTYDPTLEAIQHWVSSTGAEYAGGTLAAVLFEFLVFSK